MSTRLTAALKDVLERYESYWCDEGCGLEWKYCECPDGDWYREARAALIESLAEQKTAAVQLQWVDGTGYYSQYEKVANCKPYLLTVYPDDKGGVWYWRVDSKHSKGWRADSEEEAKAAAIAEARKLL